MRKATHGPSALHQFAKQKHSSFPTLNRTGNVRRQAAFLNCAHEITIAHDTLPRTYVSAVAFEIIRRAP